MVYAPVSIAYGEVITSAKLNQLAENDRIANEFITARQALPHVRLRHTAGSGLTAVGNGTGWAEVIMNTTPGAGANPAPVTITPTALTILSDGLYSINAQTSTTTHAFGVRLLQVNDDPTPDIGLAQSATGAVGPSQNIPLHFQGRLTAGQAFVWQVKIEVDTANMRPDAPNTPCYIDIIRLSD